MSKGRKALILTHSDCDGICAGALAASKFPESRVFFTKPVSLLHDFKDVVMKYNERTVIICDIALTKKDAAEIVSLMKKSKKRILYFDHHVVPDTVTEDGVNDAVSLYAHDTSASASEIIYRFYQKSIPRERVWLALYGAIGDYTDNTKFAIERIRNWDKRALYFEVSTLVMGIKEERFSQYNPKRGIISVLSSGQNPSDIKGLVKAAKEAVTREFNLYKIIRKRAKAYGSIGYVTDMAHFGFRGPSALFAATVTDRPVGLAANNIRDHIDITARTRSNDRELQLNKIMEEAAESVGGSGGGHPRAAGARIPKDAFGKFLDAVDKMLA
mgnify:CR=1 FL=1